MATKGIEITKTEANSLAAYASSKSAVYYHACEDDRKKQSERAMACIEGERWRAIAHGLRNADIIRVK